MESKRGRALIDRGSRNTINKGGTTRNSSFAGWISLYLSTSQTERRTI